MKIENNTIYQPFFSICIPQYNRTSFLIEACKVLSGQTFRDFEICISDDQSTDGRENELISFLKKSELSFIYKKQDKNLRYDGNIRSSIELARGRYCFLHGNDDCLASSTTLEEMYQEIQKYDSVAVIIPNYEDWQTGQVHRRVRRSHFWGAGVDVAATHFRNVAFVSGIVIDRVKAQNCYTDRWDGSEMYQMYLTSRIISSGGNLLELDKSVVRKDIQIQGESVDSYRKPKLVPCPIVERKLPMASIGSLVVNAMEPYLEASNKDKLVKKVFFQLYLFTYPFWILEYRRVQSWNYALGVCIGLRPTETISITDIYPINSIIIWQLYILSCFICLTLPIQITKRIQPTLLRIAKSFR